MGRKEVVQATLAAILAVAVVTACSDPPSPAAVARSELAADGKIGHLVIPPPNGYSPDTRPSASGGISPAVFSQAGGDGPANKTGYVAGFKETYVSAQTQEGLVITIFEFSSAKAATNYLQRTAPLTLRAAQGKQTPFSPIAGAIAIDGRKSYGGEWSHAVIANKGKFYMSLLYANGAGAGSAPVEFYNWAKLQWLLIK